MSFIAGWPANPTHTPGTKRQQQMSDLRESADLQGMDSSIQLAKKSDSFFNTVSSACHFAYSGVRGMWQLYTSPPLHAMQQLQQAYKQI